MNAPTASGHSVTENQLNKTKSAQNDYDSKAIVIFSSVSKRSKVAQLQVNTNLNESPLNFLTNEAQYYGVHHNLSQSDNFTSYRTAHMYPDFVGDIDIISNSTNIKKLFKIPFSRNSVSMMVHRIENTLLIDNYDVDNNLMAMRDDRAWLNNIFNSHNLEHSHHKKKRFTRKNKSFNVIQEETLVSKFLHHSIGDSVDCDENNQLQFNKLLPLLPDWLDFSLPDHYRSKNYPTKLINHRIYNQYMLWTFEGFQFLLGSDLPIFSGDNNSQLSLRLRDMSKPMNALTGMDYWLDNLICNVNELLMCYHLNGIVKNNKMVLTEDIPHLKGSKFSPNDVKITVKNVISFLKFNATNIGHTYWLLKEKNSDVLKLYDLTFLNSDTICQNPFTVPTAMLLYHVVQNVKHNQNNGRQSNSNSNQILLVNCLKLLNEIKYYKIIISACYLLSDIFIPINTNVRYPKLEDLFFVYSLVSNNNANEEYSFFYENGICSIDIHNLLQLSQENDEYPKFKILNSKPTVQTVKNRCKYALYYVGYGLTTMNYKKKPDDVQMTNEKNAEKVVEKEVLATSVNEETICKKNCRHKKKNEAIVENNNDIAHKTQHSLECFGSKTHIWDKAISFFYKARLTFTILAEKNYLALRFGKALKNYRFAFRCQIFIFTINGDKDQFVYLLESISICCLLMLHNWASHNQYTNEMKASNDSYDSVIKGFLEIDCEACKQFKAYTLIPDKLSTKLCLLNSAESCYQGAEEYRPYDYVKNDLYNILMKKAYIDCTTEILKMMSDNIHTKYNWVFLNMEEITSTLKQILKNGINKIKLFGSVKELAIMYMNMGKWYTNISRLELNYKCFNKMTPEKILKYFLKAKNCQLKSLEILTKVRHSNVRLWIDVSWELFIAAFDYAVTNQHMVYKEPDNVTDDNENTVLRILESTIKFSDLVNKTKYSTMYQLRTAQLHERVAVVHMFRINRNMMSEKKKRLTFKDCIHNYNVSYDLFLQVNCLVETLDVIHTLIIVDEMAFKDATSVQYKIKMFVSIGNTLRKCVPVLQSLLYINDDDPEINKSLRDQIISSLLQKIQNILKTTIKGVMKKNAGLTEKLKVVYMKSLKKNDEENEMSHLLQIVTSIIEIIQFMN